MAMQTLPADTPPSWWVRARCLRIITVGVILALLYLGRDVLIPLVLALMLSLLVAPWVRRLRRLGVGRTPAVLISVLALSVSSLAATIMLGTQILHIADSLPRYKETIERKLEVVDSVTAGRLTLLTGDRGEVSAVNAAYSLAAQPTGSPAQSMRLMGRVLQSAWKSVQAIGIVLLVLIFVLLEHESLRDRFIRLVGATDIRSATLALNDAGERLSRYFVSQFLVNLTFGMLIWASLTVLHVPQSMLFGALAGVMRFVPYVGTGMAGLAETVFAFCR